MEIKYFWCWNILNSLCNIKFRTRTRLNFMSMITKILWFNNSHYYYFLSHECYSNENFNRLALLLFQAVLDLLVLNDYIRYTSFYKTYIFLHPPTTQLFLHQILCAFFLIGGSVKPDGVAVFEGNLVFKYKSIETTFK